MKMIDPSLTATLQFPLFVWYDQQRMSLACTATVVVYLLLF